MNSRRQLIVNADDFGLSPGVNRGTVRAHEHGVVTSASLMVRGAAVAEAAAYARANPRLSVGLHLDLWEWECRDGEWRMVYGVVDATDAVAVEREVERQLAAFREMVGRDPTHLDSHQHAHRSDPLLSVARRAAGALGVVLRNDDPRVRYRGDFYGQTNRGEPCHGFVSVEAMVRVLGGLAPGLTEMGCHPGEDGDVDSVYREERAIEVRTLCDPRLREAIAAGGIDLCSFADVVGTPRR
ncbi:MAG: ChbG/HpnK family deacetylase [Verrucomicrobia bacterium]|nr:MAG: ChbG/HpnK family deacetylase [Verrucomicrobiota bacterium]